MKTRHCLTALILGSLATSSVLAQDAKKKPDYPKYTEVLKDYTKVPSSDDSTKTLYTIYRRNKDQQLLAELPRNFAKQKHYIALTVASGETYAGLQAGERYVYWRKYGKRLALIEPNTRVRSTGDNESKSSVKRLFTDRVLLDVPIVTMVKNGGPVIDLDDLLVGKAGEFFGYRARGLKKNLASIKTAKAFQNNIEIGIEVPNSRGTLQTFHYSLSQIIPDKTYKPRRADERVGYFTTSYTDFGKFKEDETRVRYINRWHLQKADPKLQLSPPKNPIVFYIEHTTPIRYRRWVREGIEIWNKAFEKVGIVNAIEVRQQDAVSGAHMKKSPEDVNYNFVRWLNNGIGTAIGPSRVNPETGQILDADIILTDGWIRHWWSNYNEVLPDVALEGYAPQTLAWLEKNPRWDPRVRLASPTQRGELMARRAREGARPFGGHAAAQVDESLIGDDEFDGLKSRYSQRNGLCMAANCKSHGIAMVQMARTVIAEEVAAAEAEAKKKKKDQKKEGEKEESEKAKEPKEQMVDGIPESFIGPLLIDLVAHEVGHTLGLRHNFKSSSVYSMEEINSEKMKGKISLAGSVMDYIPINMNVETGRIQGDYGMIDLGPYDHWAIEYGYTTAKDLKPILDRVAEPELAFATDEDTWGPDPLARRYDFGKNPLAYAKNQIRLAEKHRSKIVDNFVKDGQSWSKARRGYLLTLRTQMQAVSMMSNWVGGAFVHRDRKGDTNGRAPIKVVPAEDQRKALDFVVKNAFQDKAFGLSTKLLTHMTVDKWWDDDGFSSSIFEDPTWPIHDRVLGYQASVLTGLMNPGTLQRVYDNEFLVPADQDALTLPELLETIRKEIWGGIENGIDAKAPKATARKPMLSSLKRNLQKEHLERLVDLVKPDNGFTAARKPISNLASDQLQQIQAAVDKVKGSDKLDPYTRSHFADVSKLIGKVLDADYVIDVSPQQNSLPFFFFGKESEKK